MRARAIALCCQKKDFYLKFFNRDEDWTYAAIGIVLDVVRAYLAA